ncbi:hypothetical protein [Burkholderia sp. PU8-34]
MPDSKGTARLQVSIDELIEYALANYLGMPHVDLTNVTPFDAVEYFVRVSTSRTQGRLNIILAQFA